MPNVYILLFSHIVPPSFTSPYYSGTYIIDNENHEVATDTIQISEDYSNYASLELVVTGGNFYF